MITLREAKDSDLKFKDISCEVYREYVDGDGVFHRIEKPVCMAISKSGNHRVLDSEGISHAVDLRFKIAVKWKNDPSSPHFNF